MSDSPSRPHRRPVRAAIAALALAPACGHAAAAATAAAVLGTTPAAGQGTVAALAYDSPAVVVQGSDAVLHAHLVNVAPTDVVTAYVYGYGLEPSFPAPIASVSRLVIPSVSLWMISVTGTVAQVDAALATFYMRPLQIGQGTISTMVSVRGKSGPSFNFDVRSVGIVEQPLAGSLGAGAPLILEAESYSRHRAAGLQRWEVVADAGASGGRAVVSLPDAGNRIEYTQVQGGSTAAGSPCLSYLLEVAAPGAYVVWIRGAGGPDSDSVHAGVDGVAATQGKNLSAFPYPDQAGTDAWRWSNRAMLVVGDPPVYTPGGPVVVTFPSAGRHTLDLWVREDGIRLDQVMLTPLGRSTTGPAGAVLPAAAGPLTLVADAARASATTTAGAHVFTPVADGAGRTLMTALPDVGAPPIDGQTPMLAFDVHLPRAGTWYVWVRGSGPDAAGDSVTLGLDGAVQATATALTLPVGATGWSAALMGGGVARLAVAGPGDHRVNLWMREDGVRVDQIALAADAAWRPAGGALAATPRGAPFLQDAATRTVAIDAVHAHTVLAGTLDRWMPTALAGSASGTAMAAGPDDGTVGGVPVLGYHVAFRYPGTYRVWVRGAAPDANGDSLNIGLDGVLQASADKIAGFAHSAARDRWTWSSATMDGAPATITVPAAGERTIQVLMREDGFAIDRLLITPSTATPAGTGPAESPQQPAAPAGVG